MCHKLHLFSNQRLAGRFDARAKGDNKIGMETKAIVIRLTGDPFAEDRVRRIFQAYEYLGSRHRQALAGPNVKRHTGPTPVVDIKTNSSEGFDLRVRRNARLFSIALELSSHDTAGLQWSHRPHDANFFIADTNRFASSRRIHRQEHRDLQQVILDNIAKSAHFIVEFSPAPNTEFFRHGHLDALDMLMVPDRLQK